MYFVERLGLRKVKLWGFSLLLFNLEFEFVSLMLWVQINQNSINGGSPSFLSIKSMSFGWINVGTFIDINNVGFDFKSCGLLFVENRVFKRVVFRSVDLGLYLE